jgi:hypothetical protein
MTWKIERKSAKNRAECPKRLMSKGNRLPSDPAGNALPDGLRRQAMAAVSAADAAA